MIIITRQKTRGPIVQYPERVVGRIQEELAILMMDSKVKEQCRVVEK